MSLALITILCFADDDIRVVPTPPFADSVTEGDVRWDKGKHQLRLSIFDLTQSPGNAPL